MNKPLTTCQQAGNKQCEHILLTSCWNTIATSLLQVCYNLCVFTCVVYEMVPKSDIRVCVSIRVSVGVRCGVRVRFSIVASGWLLILLRFNDLKNWRPS